MFSAKPPKLEYSTDTNDIRLMSCTLSVRDWNYRSSVEKRHIVPFMLHCEGEATLQPRVPNVESSEQLRASFRIEPSTESSERSEQLPTMVANPFLIGTATIARDTLLATVKIPESAILELWRSVSVPLASNGRAYLKAVLYRPDGESADFWKRWRFRSGDTLITAFVGSIELDLYAK